MAKFGTQFKGYDKKEVDAYLYKTTEHYESRERELEGCIKRLKEENDYLYAKNGEYHRNEEKVSGAILKAMEVKGDLERELRTKIELEEDRLRIFKSKWLAYVRGINHANADRVLTDTDGYIEAFRRDFIDKATRELDLKKEEDSVAEKSYRAERERIAAITRDRPAAPDEKDAVPPPILRPEKDDVTRIRYGFDEE